MSTDVIPQNNRMYPIIAISRIKNPSRFYAIPIIGILVKVIILVPVWVEITILSLVDLFVLLINSFIVLFTGNYWKVAYDLNVALIRMTVKISFFLTGLTNKYPGFSLTVDDEYSVDIPYNKHPNRLFAFPFFGGLVRIIILIPFLLYSSVISYASNASIIISWIPVLFIGYYPETTLEITRDSARISQATSAYLAGLSDTYPAFWISMNHKTLKIILIIVGVLAVIFNNGSRILQQARMKTTMQQHFMKQQIPTQTQSSSSTY